MSFSVLLMALADGKEKKSFERPRSGQVWANVGKCGKVWEESVAQTGGGARCR